MTILFSWKWCVESPEYYLYRNLIPDNYLFLAKHLSNSIAVWKSGKYRGYMWPAPCFWYFESVSLPWIIFYVIKSFFVPFLALKHPYFPNVSKRMIFYPFFSWEILLFFEDKVLLWPLANNVKVVKFYQKSVFKWKVKLQQTLSASTFYFIYRAKIVIHFLTPHRQLKTSKRKE